MNWTDKRVMLSITKGEAQAIFLLPKNETKYLWKPPLYLSNCRRCENKEYLGSVKRKNYEISYNVETKEFQMFIRDTVPFRCIYNFQDYPLDEHKCKITVELRIKDERELFRVHVDHRPMMIDKLVDNLNYRIPSEYYYMKFDSGIACLQSENVKKYECLEYIIQFRRILFHYLMTLYIPSCMTVILSWLTLWLDVEEGAARVTIGVMNMLILSTEYASYIKILPEVTYVKAIDIWMLVCLISVFSLLVEFFVASYLNKRRVPHLKLVKGPIQVPKLRRITAVTTDTSEYRSFLPNQQYPVNRLDKIFRYAFPLVFGMFNIAYWTYYGLRTSVWS